MVDKGWVDMAINAALDAGCATLEYYGKSPDVNWKADNTPVTVADKAADACIYEYMKDTGIPVFSEEKKMPSFEERRHIPRFWLIDPLDGTKEFIKGGDDYTINIALIENGIPVFGVVYLPVPDQLYFGTEGKGSFRADHASVQQDLRASATALPDHQGDKPVLMVTKSHMNRATMDYLEEMKKAFKDLQSIHAGSSLKFCRLAEGRADIHPRLGNIHEWDTAAGDAVLRAAGGATLQMHNRVDLPYNTEDMRVGNYVALSLRMLTNAHLPDAIFSQ